jgi:hypothetical protein
MFKSTLFSAAGGTINASGGSSAGNAGGNGRYVVSENSSTSTNYGTRVGTSEYFFSGQAARDINPLIGVVGTTTYNIAGLQGGADVYGIMSGVSASDSFFNDVRTSAPANAVAALVRRNIGPTGDHYLGQDHLLLVNLTETPLNNPALGVGTPGSSFSVPLLERGFAHNPAFGGTGEITLNQLPAESVYATLIGENEHLSVNASVNGFGVSEIPFDTLDVVYLTGLPGDFNHDGAVNAADYVVWRKTDGGPTNYNLWRTNFGKSLSAGTGAAVVSSANMLVPEPSTCVLVMSAVACLCFRQRRAL